MVLIRFGIEHRNHIETITVGDRNTENRLAGSAPSSRFEPQIEIHSPFSLFLNLTFLLHALRKMKDFQPFRFTWSQVGLDQVCVSLINHCLSSFEILDQELDS